MSRAAPLRVGESLVADNADLWRLLPAHPFLAATGRGTLPAEAFDRWLVEDHHFVVVFRRFLARLLALAPDEPARDLLASGLAELTPELVLFRAAAAERGLDLDTEPGPTGLGYACYLLASLEDGFRSGLVVLYGAERAYADAWTAVRERAVADSPYRSFIENWSAPAFTDYVAELGTLLHRVTDGRAAEPERRAFRRTVRLELRFWDAVYTGETW